MLANNVDSISNWSLLFKILGFMPIELFSEKTIYDDKEAHSAVKKLVERLGIKLCEAIDDHI